MRVLVIDDNEDMRELIRYILVDQGFEVDTAANGALGLESQRRSAAEIVITDIFMPEVDGLETLMTLRREFPHTKIIVISGRAADYLPSAEALGAAKTFTKPFSLDALAAAVRELVS